MVVYIRDGLKGAYIGGIMGVTKGDARSLDYSSYGEKFHAGVASDSPP